MVLPGSDGNKTVLCMRLIAFLHVAASGLACVVVCVIDWPFACRNHRSGQEKPSAYQKDDLWVISSEPSFQGPTQPGLKASLQQGWLLLARSSWHGPNKDGRSVPLSHLQTHNLIVPFDQSNMLYYFLVLIQPGTSDLLSSHNKVTP